MPHPTDKTAVTETVTRLFHALDAHDWETGQELLTEQVDAAHGSHQMTLSNEEFMAELKEMHAGFDATQYLLGPIVVEFDTEDEATARFHVRWTALLTDATEEPIYVHGAHYTVGLTRLHDTWAIRSMSHEETYEEGDRGLLKAARQRAV